MKKSKIPTLLGIAILALGLAIGVYLVQNQQIFRLGATPEASPKDVRITNITDSSFSVSWTTDIEVGGFVKYSESNSSLNKTALTKLAEKSYTHYAVVENLNKESAYQFKINSGSEDFDNNGANWLVTTGSLISGGDQSNIISGSVLTQTGVVAKDAIVYISAGGISPLSTITSENGTFTVNLATARNQSLNSFATISEANTLLEIFVQSGQRGVATAQIYPEATKPAPPIILGQVHDFKNLPPSNSGGTPKASVGLPQNTGEKESGFNVSEESSAPTSETITLESIEDGEIISTTTPEFFGEGPPGTTVKITVESEVVSGEVAVNSSGNWSWNPPGNLEEGPHTITISWRDAGGILRTLKRTFIVQAAEGPAFESTPSASTSPTASPTTSPTATSSSTPSTSSSPTSTPEKLVDAGSLTPTYLLTIMGLGLFGISGLAAYLVFSKNK